MIQFSNLGEPKAQGLPPAGTMGQGFPAAPGVVHTSRCFSLRAVSQVGGFWILPEHTGNQSHDRTTEKSRRRQWTWVCLSQEALAPVFTSTAFLDLGQVRFPLLPLSGDRAEGGKGKGKISLPDTREESFCSVRWKRQ